MCKFGFELYLVGERLPFVDYGNYCPNIPIMKKWTSPVSLCLVLFSMFGTAQERTSNTALKAIVTFMDPNKSIIVNTETSERHTTLLTALRATELDAVLDYDGQFTVFAPSNLAFEKLSKATVNRMLDPQNKKALRDILSYHIIAGKLSASKILSAMCRGKGKATFTTILGEEITATMSGIDIILTDPQGNSAMIILADSNQCNGVIHEIDSVFLPVKM